MNLKNTVSVKLTFLPLSNKTALEREFLASLQKLPCLERVLKHQAAIFKPAPTQLVRYVKKARSPVSELNSR